MLASKRLQRRGLRDLAPAAVVFRVRAAFGDPPEDQLGTNCLREAASVMCYP
jgi:hypothetical protein